MTYTGDGCPGIPEQQVFRLNGCYPSWHPGSLSPTPYNPAADRYMMWGQRLNNNGQLRWYPGRGYKFNNPDPSKWRLPEYRPESPAVQPLPGQPSFPPVPPYRDRPGFGARPAPRPRPIEKPTQPPGKERKVRVSKGVMAAWNAAMEFLEFGDVVDAFWESLPKELRDKTDKTGKVSDSGLNPGMPYSTDYDKAKLIYEHWETFSDVQLTKGMSAVLLNELMDQLWGRLFGGADKFRDRAGGTGWGFGVG